MPVLIVAFDPRVTSGSKWKDFSINNILNKLPAVIAEALSVDGNKDAQLTKKDIAIRVHELGVFDVNNCSLYLTIEANDFPERKANLQERVDFISKKIKSLKIVPKALCADNQVALWVRLLPAGFTFVN